MESGKPSRSCDWLYRWLLFRLLFASGLVKLGDPTWDSFTALGLSLSNLLPTVLGWFAYQLPHWCQLFPTAATLFIELLIPPFDFMGRKLRNHIAQFKFLQLVIILTGNFCFFNWLTIALCLFLSR
ncbi:MAG: lipase maturation factor family protein [Cyanobacteriota/Melainabacteria group bacterium]